MKKLLLVPLLLILLACGSDTEQAESTVGITAPDGYAISCSPGYARKVPHLCVTTGVLTDFVILTADSTCRTTAFTSIPSNAAGVILSYEVIMTSSGVANLKGAILATYTDASCTTLSTPIQYSGYEFAAVAANTEIYHFRTTIDFVPLVSGNVRYIASFVNNGVGIKAHDFSIIGYYD